MAVLPRIRFCAVTKRYCGTVALDGVSFDVAAGSIHALVGENGAGKSTLMKCLSGATELTSGSIELDGVTTPLATPLESQRQGIAMVYQELSIAPHLSVAENIFLGRWPRNSFFGGVNFRAMHVGAAALLADLQVDLPLRQAAGTLTVARQQMVEITKALSMDARVLILDEPSAVLTPNELAALFPILKRLAARGVSVLYISHRLEEIFSIADEVTVLRDARHISTRPIERTSRDALVHEMVGRPIDQEFPPRDARIGARALRVSGLSAAGRFRDVSFEVRRGEIFGLAGLVGSGRSSVAMAICGALPGASGNVEITGGTTPRAGLFRSPRDAQRAGVAYVPEDRKRSGLLLARNIRENLSLGNERQYSRFGVINLREEHAAAAAAIGNFNIKASGAGVSTGSLSGGNQQKVLLARWMRGDYRIVFLDEPTRGVDVGAKTEIYAMIHALAARGVAVIVISSELPEAIGLCDRIGVMQDGRMRGILENAPTRTTQEAILRLAIGVD